MSKCFLAHSSWISKNAKIIGSNLLNILKLSYLTRIKRAFRRVLTLHCIVDVVDIVTT